jgi:spore coat polysaccharide biosynthesis protein SpsF (cytidylyltransferase family)/sialic acid synthase SpsE
MKPEIEVVAEVANCHSGSTSYILELISALSEARFKYVKFQIYTVDELIHPRHSRYAHFKSQVLKDESWIEIFQVTRQLGLVPIVDVYGEQSLQFALENEIYRIKMPATNTDFLSSIQRQPLRNRLTHAYISTTGLKIYDLCEITHYLNESLKLSKSPTLIHGHQEYPTPIEHTNLHHLQRLVRRMGHMARFGFADHTNPSNGEISRACSMAITAGAEYIEKHVCLKRSSTKVDFQSSIEVGEFERFQSEIREAIALSSAGLPSEDDAIAGYLKRMKKFPHASRDLMAETRLTPSDVIHLRSEDVNLSLSRLRGNEVTRRAIKKGELAKFEDFRHNVTAVVLCRTDSKRLANKAIAPIEGEIPILHLLHRVSKVKSIDNVFLATTDRALDDDLCELVLSEGFKVYRGSTQDVLGRFLAAGNSCLTNHIIRITGDDILLSTDDLQKAIESHIIGEAHYTSMLTIPSGCEAEIFEYRFLSSFSRSIDASWDTEYLTDLINKISDEEIRKFQYVGNESVNRNWRLTLDDENDQIVLGKVFRKLREESILQTYDLADLVRVIESNKELLRLVTSREKRQHTGRQEEFVFDWRME